MYRLVYFGLSGGFSTVPLAALCRAGYPPLVVVHGLPPVAKAVRAPVQVRPARPGLFDRMQVRLQARLRRAEAAPRPDKDLVREAHALGLDVLETPNANDTKVLGMLEDLAPDAFVVCGFNHLLSRRALAIPTRGGLNLHPGALPEERGAAPLFWALKEGRTNIRWTIHVLDEGEDSGDVVSAGAVDFEPGLAGQAVLEQIAIAAAPPLVRALRALMAGDLVRTPQPATDAERKRRPTFRDGRIEVRRPAVEVFTFVAGCARSHSVWAECAGDRFFIARAIGFDPDARPDFEWFLTGDRLLLRCAPGIVELELKRDGALFSAEYEEEEAAASGEAGPPATS